MNKEIPGVLNKIENQVYHGQLPKKDFVDLKKYIKNLQHQLEEKDKVIADMHMVGNGTLSLDRLLEILERGKYGK